MAKMIEKRDNPMEGGIIINSKNGLLIDGKLHIQVHNAPNATQLCEQCSLSKIEGFDCEFICITCAFMRCDYFIENDQRTQP